MGLFQQTVSVLDGAGVKAAEVEAWVDTGSTYTWLPRSLLTRLSIEPSEEREFILANGTREKRQVAQVRISLGGPAFYTYCAFAGEGEEVLLGAVALEEAGLAVDPVNRRLVPTAGYALTAILRRPSWRRSVGALITANRCDDLFCDISLAEGTFDSSYSRLIAVKLCREWTSINARANYDQSEFC